MGRAGYAPPGWPEPVPPPDAPGWEATAVAWLFDVCPPDYRAYEVFRRHPVVLARMAVQHLDAAVAAARAGFATARADLADVVDDTTVEATLAAYEREGRRLASAARAARLVADALRGTRFTPRL